MQKTKTAQGPGRADGAGNTSRGNGAILIIAALDMSWRLAIAVLVPIIGGFELDKHWHITPVLTIIGFVLAMAGLFFILRRTMSLANEKFKTRTPK